MAGFCQNSQTTSSTPIWADPLGPTSIGPGGRANYGASGAPQMRSGLFNYLSGVQPQMQGAAQSAATGYQNAAANPFWQQAQAQAQKTLSGDYLSGSPELNRALAANTSGALSAAADADARQKAQMAKAGQSFGTADLQASEANKAAALADANRTNAQAYLSNYQAERGAQQAAPGAFAQAQSTPLNYLSQVSPALTQPASATGNILSALSSGGQTIMPTQTTTMNPGLGTSIMNGIGAY